MNAQTRKTSKPLLANSSSQFILEPDDSQRFAELCGQFNQNLKQIEQRLSVKIHNRGNTFSVTGEGDAARAAQEILKRLYRETGKKKTAYPRDGSPVSSGVGS